MSDGSNVVATENQVWVCGACGKLSKDKYGNQAISYGWDESCYMHAVLCLYPPKAGPDGKPIYEPVEPQP